MNLRAAGQTRQADAFTLVEVVVSIAIAGVIFSAVLLAYVNAAKYAEWSGYSLAAEALNVQQLEQLKCAKWDTDVLPNVDETTNLNLTAWSYVNGAYKGYTNAILDMPISGTNIVRATNRLWLTNVMISANPPVWIKHVTVSTEWSFRGEKYTNTIATIMGPDR